MLVILFLVSINVSEGKKNELQLTAEAYYHTVSPDIKAEADKFFLEMDKDKNKK